MKTEESLLALTATLLVLILQCKTIKAESLGELFAERPLREINWREVKLPDGIPNILDMKTMAEYMKAQSLSYPGLVERSESHRMSIGESATIAFDWAIENKIQLAALCDKYVDIFKHTDGLTKSEVDQIIEMKRKVSDVEQQNAYLIAKLGSEIDFNSLERLSLLFETLTREGVGVVSTFDVRVQESIARCITHFRERHERAIADLGEYIKDKREKSPYIAPMLEKIEAEFSKLIKQLLDIEDEMGLMKSNNLNLNMFDRWMSKLADLYRMTQNSYFTNLNEVNKFVSHPKRKDKYEVIQMLVDRVEKLKRRAIELEGNDDKLSDYRDVLVELYDFLEPHRSWFQKDYEFVTDNRRNAIIAGALYRFDNGGQLPKPEMLISIKEPMSRSKPELSDMSELGTSDLNIDFKFLDDEDIESDQNLYSLDEQENKLTFFVAKAPKDDPNAQAILAGEVVDTVLKRLEDECKESAQVHSKSCDHFQQIQAILAN